MAYLGFHDLDDVGRMTLSEYYLRLEAHALAKLDQREMLAIQAWNNQTVQATTKGKHPKPIYKKFEQFFDRNAQEQKIRHSFADDYAIPNQKTSRQAQNEIFYQRYEEFKKLQAAGKIDPNAWKRERNGGD